MAKLVEKESFSMVDGLADNVAKMDINTAVSVTDTSYGGRGVVSADTLSDNTCSLNVIIPNKLAVLNIPMITINAGTYAKRTSYKIGNFTTAAHAVLPSKFLAFGIGQLEGKLVQVFASRGNSDLFANGIWFRAINEAITAGSAGSSEWNNRMLFVPQLVIVDMA